jgi:hypothetical protein
MTMRRRSTASTGSPENDDISELANSPSSPRSNFSSNLSWSRTSTGEITLPIHTSAPIAVHTCPTTSRVMREILTFLRVHH